jgi:hypothetical protein
MQTSIHIVNVFELNDKKIWKNGYLSFTTKSIKITIDGNLTD